MNINEVLHLKKVSVNNELFPLETFSMHNQTNYSHTKKTCSCLHKYIFPD